MADEDNDSPLLAEFEEFLKAKEEKQKKDQASEDFEVEIWDEKGRGVRTRRSHAKPFLNSLGIDVDAPEGDDKGDGKGDGKGDSKPKPKGKATSNQTASGIAARYFTRDKKD